MSQSRALLPALFNYRRGEGRLLGQLIGLLFLKGIADVFFATSASTLYLSRYSPATLPFVYLGSAVAATLLGLAYSRLTPHLRANLLLKVTLGGVALSIAGLHAALWLTGDGRWALALMVWREVLNMLLNATLWAQVGALLNLRQGKRLFAVIAGGDVVASSIAGAAIPFLIDAIGPLHLLAFAEVSLVLGVLLSLVIDRSQSTVAAEDDDDQAPDTRSLRTLLGDRYLALFFAVSATSFLIYFVVDYNFYNVVNTQFSNPPVLASFFGAYYAVLNAVSLVMNGVVSGRLLSRYGIGVGLLALPALVGAAVAAAVAGHEWWGAASALFWTVVVTKLLDEMLRGAFLYPTYKILYQPLPSRERVRVQAARDSVVEPVAIGLSALVLLAFTRLAGFGVPQLCIVLLVVVAVFAGLAVALRREYVNVLVKALTRGRSFDDSQLLANASSVAVLHHGVRHHQASHAIYCLTLLESVDARAATHDLLAALSHGDERVRSHAARRLRHLGVSAAAAPLDALVASETSPMALREALWSACELGGRNAIANALRHSDDADLEPRTGALIGLLRQTRSTDASTTARDRLERLAASPNPDERIVAARIIGEAGLPDLSDDLRTLMNDADLRVVHAALSAAPGCGNQDLMTDLIARFDDPDARDTAAAALLGFGDDAVAPVVRALEQTTGPDATRLVQLLGRLGGAGRVALVDRLTGARDALRGDVIEALTRTSYVASGAYVPRVRRVLIEELQAAGHLATIRHQLRGIADELPLLRGGIENDFREATQRVLMMLSFLYDRAMVGETRRMLSHGTEEQRAQAIELIDNVLPRAEAALVMRLLDDAPTERASSNAARSLTECAVDIVRANAASPWSRACAVYEAAAASPHDFQEAAQLALEDPDFLVRETATATLARYAAAR